MSAIFGYVTGRAVDDNAVVTLRYPNGAIGVVETAYVAQYSPFSIEVHGTRGSILYSETGIGEMIARMRPGQHPLPVLGIRVRVPMAGCTSAAMSLQELNTTGLSAIYQPRCHRLLTNGSRTSSAAHAPLKTWL